MNNQVIPAISSATRRELCTLVVGGMHREAAAQSLGYDPVELIDLTISDRSFAMELLQAERTYELLHLRNIAAAGGKHWHASAWLLERRFPAQYGKRRAASIDMFDVHGMGNRLVDMLRDHPTGEPTAERVEQLVAEFLATPRGEHPQEGDDADEKE